MKSIKCYSAYAERAADLRLEPRMILRKRRVASVRVLLPPRATPGAEFLPRGIHPRPFTSEGAKGRGGEPETHIGASRRDTSASSSFAFPSQISSPKPQEADFPLWTSVKKKVTPLLDRDHEHVSRPRGERSLSLSL